MNVRPLHDRIIVQRLEEGEQHIGGILIVKEDEVLGVSTGVPAASRDPAAAPSRSELLETT